MMTSRFELFVEDVQKSTNFYVRVLGFGAHGKQTEDYVSLVNGGVEIGLGARSNLPTNHPMALRHGSERKGVGVEIVLEVDDLTKFYHDVQEAGYPIQQPLMEQPWGLADFRLVDPDGYYLRITNH